jgi:nitronate monooxygenase
MKFKTGLTDDLSCELPIIAAPMFLVSTNALVIAASESGGVGTFPSLNFRSTELLGLGLKEIRQKTNKPFGVNLIVHKTNKRWEADLKVCADNKVPFFITSLGSPEKVISQVKSYGAKVYCDVTNLKHAKKVLDQGADGLIAVCAGAGGHAGPHSPFSLVSELLALTTKPIIVAGAVANGASILASLALGASGVSMGTRFIASHEAQASEAYKVAIINSKSENIQKSQKLTGIPASVIRTPELEKLFRDPGFIEKLIFLIEKKNQGKTRFSRWLRKSFGYNWSWNNVWSAGESVGQIREVLSVNEIFIQLLSEINQSSRSLSDKMMD